MTFVHLCLDLWVGVLHIVVVSVGLSLTAGLAVAVIGGAAALAVTLWLVGAMGGWKRRRAETFLGVSVARPRVRTEAHRYGWIGRTLTNRSHWRALGYAVVTAAPPNDHTVKPIFDGYAAETRPRISWSPRLPARLLRDRSFEA